MTVVTRFAPSPTGMLHVGGVRTALFSWLYARHVGGKFLLRVEDTDRERSTEEAVRVILEGMEWLGLNADEKVVFQSQRFGRYREVLEHMLQAGTAYRCYCTKAALHGDLPRAHDAPAGSRPGGAVPRSAGRCGGGRGSGSRAGDIPEHRAR